MTAPTPLVELFARLAIAAVFAPPTFGSEVMNARYEKAKDVALATVTEFVTEFGDAVDIPEYLELKARLWRLVGGEVVESALVELLANAHAHRELMFDRFPICVVMGDMDYPNRKESWTKYLREEMSRCLSDAIGRHFDVRSNA